jgi:SAM-dependent methyltransferase
MATRELMRQLTPRSLRSSVWKAVSALERGQQPVFERLLGVSTSGRVELEELGEDPTDRLHYEGCQWLPVRRALRTLSPGPDDVLADLGCGKGQALLIAGRLPFGRVVGVELADELAQEARRNLARARPSLRAGRTEVITADALEWRVPDDLTVLFLYCPFVGEVFHQSLGAVFASHDRAPRRLHVVYDYPWEHDWLMGTGRVRPVDVLPSVWPANPWWWRSGKVITVYRVVSLGQGDPGRPRVRRRWLRPPRALDHWSRPNGHRFELFRDGQLTRVSHT